MREELSAEMIAALDEDLIRPFLLFKGVFTSSTLRLWTGTHDLSYDSQTWLGNGWLQGFSNVSEDNEISSKGIDIELSGVPSSLVSLILSEQAFSNTGQLYLGLFNSSMVIIDTPILLFSGKLSAPSINDSGDTSKIVLSYEDDLVILQGSDESRYNHESQQRHFPGNLGFEFVSAIQTWSGFWGNKEKTQVAQKAKKSSRSKNKGKKK